MASEWIPHTFADGDLVVKNRVREFEGDGLQKQGSAAMPSSGGHARKPARASPPKALANPPKPQGMQGGPWVLLAGGLVTGVAILVSRKRRTWRPSSGQETSGSDASAPGRALGVRDPDGHPQEGTEGGLEDTGAPVTAVGARGQPADLEAEMPQRAKRPKTGSKTSSKEALLLQHTEQNGSAPAAEPSKSDRLQPSVCQSASERAAAQLLSDRAVSTAGLAEVERSEPPPAVRGESRTYLAEPMIEGARANGIADATGAGEGKSLAKRTGGGPAVMPPKGLGTNQDVRHSSQLQRRSKDGVILGMQEQLVEKERLAELHLARVKELELQLANITGSPPSTSAGHSDSDIEARASDTGKYSSEVVDSGKEVEPTPRQKSMTQPKWTSLERPVNCEDAHRGGEAAAVPGISGYPAAADQARPVTGAAGPARFHESSNEKRSKHLAEHEVQFGAHRLAHAETVPPRSADDPHQGNDARREDTTLPAHSLHDRTVQNARAGPGHSVPPVRRSLEDSLNGLQLGDASRPVVNSSQRLAENGTGPANTHKSQVEGRATNGVRESEEQRELIADEDRVGINGRAFDDIAELEQEVEELSLSLQHSYQDAAAKSQEATEIVTELQKHDMTSNDLHRKFEEDYPDEDFEEEVEGERDWRQLTEGLGTNSLANEVEIQELTAKLEKVAAAQKVEEDLAELALQEGKIAELKRRLDRLSAAEIAELATDGHPLTRSRSSHASLGSQLAGKLDAQVEQTKKTLEELRHLSASLQMSLPNVAQSKKEEFHYLVDDGPAAASEASQELRFIQGEGIYPHDSQSEKLNAGPSAGSGERALLLKAVLQSEAPTSPNSGLNRQLTGPLKSSSPPKGHRPRRTEEEMRLSRLGRQLIDPSKSPVYKESTAQILLPLGEDTSAEEALEEPEDLHQIISRLKPENSHAVPSETGKVHAADVATSPQEPDVKASGLSEQSTMHSRMGPLDQLYKETASKAAMDVATEISSLESRDSLGADAILEAMLDDMADDMFTACSTHGTPAKAFRPSPMGSSS